ncbi:MAG: hypothetical protein ACRYFS_18025 [Janthinobacterium lividum]
MEPLKKLRDKLVSNGKDESIRVALDALLLSPDDIDLQIDVLGVSHQANWLPNRKKVFWQAFPIDSEPWIARCVTRIIETAKDTNALYALLNTNVVAVAKIVQLFSPDLVSVWDVNGAPSCGIGLADRRENSFDRYFYIAWKPVHDSICRLEFISHIEAPQDQHRDELDRISGPRETVGGIWAELPYGFDYWIGRREFTVFSAYIKPHGFSETVRRQLGYESEFSVEQYLL